MTLKSQVFQLIIDFNYRYNEQQRNKLIERRLGCYYRLGNYDKVMEVIGQEKSLELEIFKTYEKNINDIKKKKETEKEPVIDDDVKRYLDSHIDIVYEIPKDEKNPRIQSASKSVAIEYGVEKGFYIKSETEIEAGELIVDEPPYASVLLGSNLQTFCYECQEKLAPLKQNICYCRQCINVAYCSRECEKKSWPMHRHECKYIKFLGMFKFIYL